MNREKKRLLQAINTLEIKVKSEKNKQKKHRNYFSRLINNQGFLLSALLVPAFLTGWQGGKKARGGHVLKRFGKYGFLTVLSLVRRYYKLI